MQNTLQKKTTSTGENYGDIEFINTFEHDVLVQVVITLQQITLKPGEAVQSEVLPNSNAVLIAQEIAKKE